MIVYIDTSALVKIYCLEYGRETVQKAIEEAELVFTSLITYPEMRSTLWRRKREGDFKRGEYDKILSVFEKDWKEIQSIPVSYELAIESGFLAGKYVLRGMDAIHVASAGFIRQETQEEVYFLSADKNQIHAASKEHLKTKIS